MRFVRSHFVLDSEVQGKYTGTAIDMPSSVASTTCQTTVYQRDECAYFYGLQDVLHGPFLRPPSAIPYDYGQEIVLDLDKFSQSAWS